MSRMDDAAIREAMQSDGLPPESGGTILRLAVEALARGEEIAALERSEQRLAACVSNGDGNIRRLEREAEGLRAEVANAKRRAEDAEAKIARQAEELTTKDATLRQRTIDLDAMAWVWCDGGCKSGVFRYPENAELRPLTREMVARALRNVERMAGKLANLEVKEESERPAIWAAHAARSVANERVREAEAEVARLTAERDEANAACLARGNLLDEHRKGCAWMARAEAAEAEVARLRAAAIPEDAEEIVFKELSIGVFEPQDLEIQEAIHAKRRAKARAVVKALRRDA